MKEPMQTQATHEFIADLLKGGALSRAAGKRMTDLVIELERNRVVIDWMFKHWHALRPALPEMIDMACQNHLLEAWKSLDKAIHQVQCAQPNELSERLAGLQEARFPMTKALRIHAQENRDARPT